MSSPQVSQPAPREPESVAGRYQLRRRLGGGGMGEVHEALDLSTGKSIALKRIRATLLDHSGRLGDFMREYHALASLRHPRIIEVYDYGVHREQPYYTMELLDGSDLSQLSPLTFREACLYLRDVASSLALLHARRLLHRDVSPRNVRRTGDGRCKLIDFGAMIAFGVPPNITGTAPCIAPEALQGAPLDQRTDLYSLGAVAYRLLTGHFAYAVSELDELPAAWKQLPRRPRSLVSDIPEALDDLVMSLLHLDPMKRPRSAAEVIDWLTRIAQLPADDSPAAARSFLITSRLSGRDEARTILERSMQRARAGEPATILVEGRAGTGKSRMLGEAALLAQTCGLTVVRAAARSQHSAAQSLAQELVTTLCQIMPAEARRAGAQTFTWRPSARPSNDSDAGERRNRMQQDLLTLFRSVASQRPLAMIVDDLDRADEFSVAFLVALAFQARDLPLVLVASRSEEQSSLYPSAGEAFAERATRLLLADLDRACSHELLASMFGPVPNLERFAAWMFRAAHGNPKLTTALAEHLLERDVLRYVDGAWVLPGDEITVPVPADLVHALELRLKRLGPEASALAEILSVRRGGATAELCVLVAAGQAQEVFASLDELVREGVLESAGHEVAFAHDELRELVLRSLAPARARELHQRWADVLLAQPDLNLDVELEAGWHLIHTEHELRGAELLARVGPLLVEQGQAMAAALPAIEAALAVYERSERGDARLDTCLRLRATLVLSGYLFDYRLALRYGEETLDRLHRASGLALAERLGRFVGARLGFALAFAATAIRRLLLPRAKRGPRVAHAMQYLLRAAMGLMGVRAVALDAPGTASVLAKLAPLEGTPAFTGARLIYRTCQAIVLQMCGRESAVDRTLRDAFALLRKPRSPFMSAADHRELTIGLLTCDGINECYREPSEALQRASSLEGIGTSLARAAAHRIRLIHSLTRGDLERAEECRRAIDLQGIQGGTTWQVEWFAAPIEGMLGGAVWGDLMLLRRSIDRLERLVQHIPALRPHLHSIQIAHHFRRGELERAATLGEQYVRDHPPHTLVGWGATYAVTALALIENGDARRALELCEHARAHVSEADRSYTVLYGQLEVAHATALAALGERERAEAILHAHLERRRTAGDRAGLVAVHQDRARIARLLGDRPMLDDALANMRQAALESACPALILLADRTTALRSARRSPPPQTSDGAESVTPVQDDDVGGVTKFLRGCRSTRDRCRIALQMLARCLGSEEAYVFTCEGSELAQVSALDQRVSAESLIEQLHEFLPREPATLSGAFEMRAAQVLDSSGAKAPFFIFLLAEPAVPGACSGIAAIRDNGAAPEPLPLPVLAELCGVLADDLRRQTARTRAPRSSTV